MRSLNRVLLLPLLLSGCLGSCGPTYNGVNWYEPRFADILADAEPEGWDVRVEPHPSGFPVEHPWLDAWNASLRSIVLIERVWVEDEEHGESHPQQDLVAVLSVPGRLVVHAPLGADVQRARPTALRLLETLTDGNESERRAWMEELFTERDPTEEDPTGAPYARIVPHRVDLPPERLRLQPFVDEHLDDDADPAATLRSGDWSLQVAFAQTVAVRGDQEFRASPERNEFHPGKAYDDEQPLLEDFQRAYASLGLGPAPEDVESDGSTC